MRDEATTQRCARERQIADGIQQLMADELVRHAQAGRIEHPRLIDHDRVFQATALGQAGGAQLINFLGSVKVRARASSWRKLSGVSRSDSAWRPIAAASKSIDSAMSRPVAAGA